MFVSFPAPYLFYQQWDHWVKNHFSSSAQRLDVNCASRSVFSNTRWPLGLFWRCVMLWAVAHSPACFSTTKPADQRISSWMSVFVICVFSFDFHDEKWKKFGKFEFERKQPYNSAFLPSICLRLVPRFSCFCAWSCARSRFARFDETSVVLCCDFALVTKLSFTYIAQ